MLTASSSSSALLRLGGGGGFVIRRTTNLNLRASRSLRSKNRRDISQDASVDLSSSEVQSVVRHGVGDGVVVLDVGGKEFKTLRSTIATNRVLSDLVRCAENNSELTQKGAVFVDRDPTHFGLILQHLRNKTDGLSYQSYQHVGKLLPGATTKNKLSTSVTVQLPEKSAVLREIYLEATYYDIKELQSTACGKSFLTWIYGSVLKNSNPFDSASKLVARLRGGLAAAVGLMGVGNANIILDTLPTRVKELILPETKVFDELSKKSNEDKKEVQGGKR